MTTNFAQNSPYLRTSRGFPEEIQPLVVQINKAYVDVANAVNERTIGLFVQGKAAITGESWFISSRKQQSIRQMYNFTSFTSPQSIPHGINTSQISGFTRIYGTATNGTNWYPLPYIDSTAVANQIQIVITPANIVITAGAGAPAITSGFVVLEWLAQT